MSRHDKVPFSSGEDLPTWVEESAGLATAEGHIGQSKESYGDPIEATLAVTGSATTPRPELNPEGFGRRWQAHLKAEGLLRQAF